MIIKDVTHMTPDERDDIVTDVESSDLGTDENQYTEYELEMIESGEMYVGDDGKLHYADETLDSSEVVQVTETVTRVAQPLITHVESCAETGAKGEIKPYCKLSITRHLEFDGATETEAYELMAKDFHELAIMTEKKIVELEQKTNKNRPKTA